MRSVCVTETTDIRAEADPVPPVPPVPLWRPWRWWRRATPMAPAAVTVLGLMAGPAAALPPAPAGIVPVPRASAAAAPHVHRVAVFGEDNRTKLPKRLEPLRGSIGLIYNERTRTVCTAFCVGDDVIATASHCVYRTRGEPPPPPERFYFARPGTTHPSVRFAGAATRASAQQIVAGAVGISTKPPIEAARDWAIVKLQGPACRGRTLPVDPLTTGDIEREAAAGRLFQAAFHRDYGRWTMAYSEPCFAGRRGEQHGPTPQISERDFTDPLNLVLHTCDTGGASSGSPLLVETPTGAKVVAINVGTFVQSRVMIEEGVVVRRTAASAVANTAVSAIAFAGKLEPMRAASVLTLPADISALQRHLVAAGLLDGPANGRFEPRLRLAIELYEAASGLPVLGLPTKAVLDHLGRPR